MAYSLRCEHRDCNNESKYEIEFMDEESSIVSAAVCGPCFDRVCNNLEGRVTVVANRRKYRMRQV